MKQMTTPVSRYLFYIILGINTNIFTKKYSSIRWLKSVTLNIQFISNMKIYICIKQYKNIIKL